MALVTNDWKIDVFIAVSILCIWLYYRIRTLYSYFEKRNIKYVKPTFLLGSDPDGTLFKIHIADSWDRIYKKLENEKYGGYYHAIFPSIMIRDPEYINLILKTSFEHFTDRVFLIDEKTNPLDENIFFLRGKKWRVLRNKMAPLFTTVKLRWMHEEIVNCSNIFEKCVDKLCDGTDTDIRDLLARYTTDVIASCGFGVEPQSLMNTSSEFRKIGKDFFDPQKLDMFLLLLRFSIPRLVNLLKIKTVSAKVKEFFLSTTKNILYQRRSMGIIRNDFVQLLLELKEKGVVELDTKRDESPNEKIEFTDNLLAAQSFIFFLAGFETTSVALYFTFYLLAKHQEVQERARKEVKDVKAKCGQFTFDSLKELKFLSNCIAEAMRLYPPVPGIIRECTKDYTLPDGTVIEKGMNIIIPNLSIHRDPKYFPEPMEFKPDRFENPPPNGTYMTFGDGPRICIGKKFGEAVMISVLAKTLDNYKFDLSPMNKSEDIIKLNPKVLTSSPLNGLWIRIHKLDDS